MPIQPYGATEYLDYPALVAWCEALCAALPGWIQLSRIGSSRQGRPILLITVGDTRDGADPARNPAVWLDGGTHASEWAGVMSTLFTLSRWAEQIEGGSHRFSEQTAYVVPCISPDGFQAMCEGAPYVRSSLRPPLPGAAHRVGLEPQDIDGDGEVLWMRWPHPGGPFVDDEDGLPRARQLTDDPARAYQMCAEGLFLDWDGFRWRQASLRYGQDLNRNFSGSWAPFGMFGMDAGRYALSEPESRAVTDALAARENVGAAITNHTYTGALLTQPYRADSALGEPDIRMLERLAEEATRGTGYTVHRVHPDFTYDARQPIVGVWSDTLATVFGVAAYTLELWNPFAWAGVTVERPADFFRKPTPEVVSAILRKARAEPRGWADWRPFDHPQLGAVEIGGLRHLRTVRNPPEAELFTECVRAFTVVERARAALPRLGVSLHAEVLSDGTTQLTALVENTGFLPTSSTQRGAQVAAAVPVIVSVEPGDGVVLRSGAASVDLGHLEGWGSALVGAASTPVYPGLSAEGPRRIARWILQGSGTVQVRWRGGRAGDGAASAVI